MPKLKNEIGAFRKAIKAGVKEFKAASKPSRYSAAAIEIQCPHCQGKEFELGKGGSVAMMFATHTLACSKCGLIQWFVTVPDRLSDSV